MVHIKQMCKTSNVRRDSAIRATLSYKEKVGGTHSHKENAHQLPKALPALCH